MLRLAVAHRAETFQRLRDPLRERGIDPVHLSHSERVVDLRGLGPDGARAPPWDPGAVDCGLVFPGREMEGAVLDAVLDVPWVNDREAVLTSRNKAGVLAELGAAGLPVPESALVSNPADRDAVDDLFETFDGPVVVKPNSTTRGVGVARADDPDSFRGLVDFLDLAHAFPATGDRSFVVQEFLPEATDYRVMVVDGEYAGAVRRALPEDARAQGRWKANVHRGAEATGVDLDPTLRDLAEDVAGTLGIDWLGVDLLVTDDRAVVNETNARPTVDDAAKYEPDFFDRLASLVERTAA